MIERYETVADSGGAGLHRGGNGIDMVYRFLAAGHIAIHDDRWFTYPWGVNGGKPGARARKVLVKADGTEIVVGNKREDIPVEAATSCTSSRGVAAGGATLSIATPNS